MVLAFLLLGCMDGEARSERTHDRFFYTMLPRLDGVVVGSDVVYGRATIGEVLAIEPGPEGCELSLRITSREAPIRLGDTLAVRPGMLEPDELLVVAFHGRSALLESGATLPARPRVATDMERRRAMRLVLPAVGLPSVGALVPPPGPEPPNPCAGTRAP